MPARHVRTLSAEGVPLPKIPLLAVTENESIISPLDRRSEAYRHQAAAVSAAEHLPKRQNLLTIPNALTLVRLIMVPIIILLWEWSWRWSPITAALVFIGASLTDWLDGYLARRLKIASTFGAFLDPVADKVMVCSSLVLLTSSPPAPLTHKYMLLPVCIMISRELTMSALREWAAAAGGAAHKAVKVNSLGKWKTAFQMASMGCLLVLRQGQEGLAELIPGPLTTPQVLFWSAVTSYVAFCIAAFLAAWSLAYYMSNVWTHFLYPQPSSKQH